MNAKYTEREKRAVFDEYLVLRSQGGDAQALQELIQHWYGRLYGFALGQLQDAEGAKDATQDALISISKGIRRLEDPASFPKWAYQIVIRRCADWQRREIRWRKRHVTDSHAAIEHVEARRASSEPTESGTDTEVVQRAIGRLEPELGTVVRLFYFESFSVREIAELLEVPTGTIKSRLYYARTRLKQTLGEDEDD
ncbi:MAG: RNA polymerase sigma factor [Gemmatimonadetes bacterium]|nr:RNA polymerase sigma factor [Gemmatimonadota bacterium]